VLGGEFDEERLAAAIGEPQEDIWRLGGEDGTVDPAHTTAARPFGQPLRLALDEGRLLVSETTPPVEQTLANTRPRSPSVNGHLELRVDGQVISGLADTFSPDGRLPELRVGGQLNGTTPLPARASASRWLSPLVSTRCA